jgi:hypothetical protein
VIPTKERSVALSDYRIVYFATHGLVWRRGSFEDCGLMADSWG